MEYQLRIGSDRLKIDLHIETSGTLIYEQSVESTNRFVRSYLCEMSVMFRSI